MLNGFSSKLSFNFKAFARLKNSFFLVLVLIQVLLVTLSILFYNIAAFILRNDEGEKINSTYSVLKTQIEYETSRGLLPLLAIIENPEIISLFEQGKRAELFKISKPLYDELKIQGIKQFQFNSSNLTTFLRVHHPEQFGEDLSTYRPMVQKVNLEKKRLMGLEQGRSGYGFRTVVPVFAKKGDSQNYLGTVELGSSLDGVFLQHVQKLFAGNWLVYNLSRANSENPQLIASVMAEPESKGENIFVPSREVIDRSKEGNMEFKFDSDKQRIDVFMPIKNFNEEVALLFVYSFQTNYYQNLIKIGIYSLSVALLGLVSSSLILIYLYRKITHPIRDLVEETKRIREFDLEENVAIQSTVVEIQELIDSVANMKNGLLSFRKYVPAELVRDLIETKQEAAIGGKRKNLTILFTDIANFTTISETMRPGELAEKLSEYLEIVTRTILKHHGTVDKYIGDSVMAFWGAPRDLEGHALFACQSALEIQAEIQKLNEAWSSQGKMTLATRIGIATGDTIVGNIGSNLRLNYTVIGDPVNLASRLESTNKIYGTGIIISEETYLACSDKIDVRRLDHILVKGKTEPVSIFELLAEKGDLSAKEAAFIKNFEKGLSFFESKQKIQALTVFNELKENYPQNLSIQLYIDRINKIL